MFSNVVAFDFFFRMRPKKQDSKIQTNFFVKIAVLKDDYIMYFFSMQAC